MVQVIKDVVEYVRGLKIARGVVHEVNGDQYAVRADGTLGDLVRKAAPVPLPVLHVKTLTGFVDAVKAGIDEFNPDDVAVVIVDHLTVRLASLKADDFGRRHVYIEAGCDELNPFRFGEYYTPEMFNINLEAGFLPVDGTLTGGPETLSAHVNLQRLASSLSNETVIKAGDNGLSQTIELRAGVSSNQVELPRRIPLYPYRSFREIDPVETPFLVRLKGEKDSLPKIALMEIDGGKWKGDTVQAIARWLKADGRIPDGMPVIA